MRKAQTPVSGTPPEKTAGRRSAALGWQPSPAGSPWQRAGGSCTPVPCCSMRLHQPHTGRSTARATPPPQLPALLTAMAKAAWNSACAGRAQKCSCRHSGVGGLWGGERSRVRCSAGGAWRSGHGQCDGLLGMAVQGTTGIGMRSTPGPDLRHDQAQLPQIMPRQAAPVHPEPQVGTTHLQVAPQLPWQGSRARGGLGSGRAARFCAPQHGCPMPVYCSGPCASSQAGTTACMQNWHSG